MSEDSQGTSSRSGAQNVGMFSDFQIPTYEAWRKAAEAALKGAPFEKRLITKTFEEIDLQPLYQQADIEGLPYHSYLPGFAPYLRGTEPLGHKLKPWDVSQELSCADPKEFNQALRDDMECGQSAINLPLDRAAILGLDVDRAEAKDIGSGGVSISSLDDLGQALDRIDLEQIPVFVQAGASGLPIAALLFALLQKQARAAEKLTGCIGVDPLGELACEGRLPRALTGAYEDMAKLTTWALANAPALQTILVQGHPYHNAGASATQELAFALATGVEYIRELQVRGLSIDDIAPRIRFSFSLGSNFFMEVAKLRAARLLWAKTIKSFGGNETSQKMFIHARTSTWNKTFYDPYVNMLRTTTEAFSGVVGSCNSLHVGPFDEVIRSPDNFSRRIARNTHTILSEECNLPRTVDPAGGSWYVESLTDSAARKSWELFREIEKQGGMFKALKAGVPQQQVASVANKRKDAYARRKDIFVGVNMYPNVTEKPLDIPNRDSQAFKTERVASLNSVREAIDVEWRDSALHKLDKSASAENLVKAAIHAAAGGATLGEISQKLQSGEMAETGVTPLVTRRGAEPYESLRRATEGYEAKTGARPKVFLANMGPIPQHKARADFSTSFLQVAAFDVITNNGFATAEEAATAALDSQAPVVVVCSTDASYPEVVPTLTQKIKASRPDTVILLAGYPTDQIEAHKEAGVDDFIHLRANCYDLLSNLQKKLGVAS